jgi:hypothetical protein
VEHVVFFPAPDGAPAFLRVATLEEAVRLVEHLRNSEGIAEVAVHPLGAEVPLAFRAYYRVEVPAASAEQEPAAVVEAPAVEAPLVEPVAVVVPEQPVAAEPFVEAVEPAQEQAPAEQVPVLVDAGSSNGHASDGVKSLGFFA